jgi:DNA replication protein DnaC
MTPTPTAATTATLLAAQCRQLHLPSVGARWASLEQEAVRGRLSHRAYLAGLLEQELEDRAQRRAQRRIAEARFPAVKRLSDFQFAEAPRVPAALIAQLAEGGYLDQAENVLLVGDSGTGKTMLAIGLGVAACEHGRSVRFTTVAALVNELLEARDERTLARAVGRWSRYDLMVCDELGYVTLPPTGAELLFQVLAQRAEAGSVVITTNLPFSEWTTVFPDPRLCKAVVERLTYRSHIVETGSDSYRFRRSLARQQTLRRRGPAEAPVPAAAAAAPPDRRHPPATDDAPRDPTPSSAAPPPADPPVPTSPRADIQAPRPVRPQNTPL